MWISQGLPNAADVHSLSQPFQLNVCDKKSIITCPLLRHNIHRCPSHSSPFLMNNKHQTDVDILVKYVHQILMSNSNYDSLWQTQSILTNLKIDSESPHSNPFHCQNSIWIPTLKSIFIPFVLSESQKTSIKSIISEYHGWVVITLSESHGLACELLENHIDWCIILLHMFTDKSNHDWAYIKIYSWPCPIQWLWWGQNHRLESLFVEYSCLYKNKMKTKIPYFAQFVSILEFLCTLFDIWCMGSIQLPALSSPC